MPRGIASAMSHHDIDTVLGWRGRTVLDRDGQEIGKLGDIYLDGETERPAFAGVRTGLFGRKESIVPLAERRRSRAACRCPTTRRRWRTRRATTGEEAAGEDAGQDDAMTRSEEEVRFGRSEMKPRERVRLRKVLVTDHVERTVPRRREEIRLETDPPEGNIERVEDVPEQERPSNSA